MKTGIIIISLLLLTGLFFSIRAIVLRRHVGCGIAGIIGISTVIASPFILYWLIFTPPIGFHRDLYREVIGLPYPNSAKVIKKDGDPGVWIDYGYAAVIKVSEEDYNRALQKMKYSRYLCDSTFSVGFGLDGNRVLEKAGIEYDQIEYLYYIPSTHRKNVGFHRNKRIIIVEKYRN